jgi:hypothetical protein
LIKALGYGRKKPPNNGDYNLTPTMKKCCKYKNLQTKPTDELVTYDVFLDKREEIMKEWFDLVLGVIKEVQEAGRRPNP